MKTQVVLASLLSAAAVLGAATRKRENEVLHVTDFVAGCVPHGSTCDYDFHVTNGSTSATCMATPLAYGIGELPEVDQMGCTTNPDYSFSVSRLPGGGLALTVTTVYNAKYNVSGYHNIPASEIYTENDYTMTTQHYNGSTHFKISTGFTTA